MVTVGALLFMGRATATQRRGAAASQLIPQTLEARELILWNAAGEIGIKMTAFNDTGQPEL